jgi:hypothetical protein
MEEAIARRASGCGPSTDKYSISDMYIFVLVKNGPFGISLRWVVDKVAERPVAKAALAVYALDVVWEGREAVRVLGAAIAEITDAAAPEFGPDIGKTPSTLAHAGSSAHKSFRAVRNPLISIGVRNPIIIHAANSVGSTDAPKGNEARA